MCIRSDHVTGFLVCDRRLKAIDYKCAVAPNDDNAGIAKDAPRGAAPPLNS
jgi:hypothetical protein